MDRRQFLVLTGSGAAAAAIASWVGCSHRMNRGDPSGGGTVEPGAGRPLLALLVPEDQLDGGLRGEVVGGALNHGGNALLADLAAVDLVCVTPDRLPPEAGTFAGGLPWFVLLTREQGRTTVRSYSPGGPVARAGGFLPGRSDFEARSEEARARVQTIADELHAFLLPVVGDPGKEREARAAEGRRRYVESPPPGAYWAQSNGCGRFVEGLREAGPMVACGMGMVPEVARRFLDFYVKA